MRSRVTCLLLKIAFSLLGFTGQSICRCAEPAPSVAHPDNRMRTMIYEADAIYRLRGFVGYQIDIEFQADESFVGLGAGDVEGLTFASQGNHLFIKPKASKVRTNLTVLTSRRSYHFDYEVTSAAPPLGSEPELIYTLRFSYPPRAESLNVGAESASQQLSSDASTAPANRDYWYCGDPALLPLAAFDDGVHTHLRFSPGGELPAVFVRNDDGSESLLNFSMRQDEIVIHRLARRFVLRRGKLAGCILNKGFAGGGPPLRSGTTSSSIERVTREPGP